MPAAIKIRRKPRTAQRDSVPLKEALRKQYAACGIIPSLSALADLWGFASKSSASRVVAELVTEGFLQFTAGRRLRPGPRFAAAPDTGDVVDAAVARWAEGYDEAPVRAYDLTARILRLARSIEHGVGREAARFGLKAGELLVLDALYRLGPPFTITPTSLKKHFLITLAGIAKRLERLTELGLIDRCADAQDRRRVLVRLNLKGQKLLARIVAADHAAPHIAWALGLASEEREMLSALLRRAQQQIDMGAR